MPGYVMHLAMAEKVIEKLNIKDKAFVDSFRIGSIIPDTIERTKKKDSHFWSDEEYKLFARKPDVDSFLKKYSKNLQDPYVFGYYAHLYLDKLYMDAYWAKHFSFTDDTGKTVCLYDDVKKVILDNHEVYDRDDFFSEKYYYGDYDKINAYFVEKYKLSYNEIKASLDGFKKAIADESGVDGIGELSKKNQLDVLAEMIEHLKDKEAYKKARVLDVIEIENLIEISAGVVADNYNM